MRRLSVRSQSLISDVKEKRKNKYSGMPDAILAYQTPVRQSADGRLRHYTNACQVRSALIVSPYVAILARINSRHPFYVHASLQCPRIAKLLQLAELCTVPVLTSATIGHSLIYQQPVLQILRRMLLLLITALAMLLQLIFLGQAISQLQVGEQRLRDVRWRRLAVFLLKDSILCQLEIVVVLEMTSCRQFGIYTRTRL